MSEQVDLGIDNTVDNVEEYKFEPIKGYPMLNWKGKRPFRSTRYFPAQLKEVHGTDVDGWLNKIFWGDNIQVMSHLLKTYRGQVDLIYIDPPFDSKADYKKKIKLKGTLNTKQLLNDSSFLEEKQYSDIWSNDEYLQFMYERLVLMRELLSESGSIFLHCDWHKVHHLRCIMDEIFGPDNCVNEIVICYTGPTNQKNNFPRKHDNILFYKRGNEYRFNSDEARVTYVKSNKATGRTSLAGRAEDEYLDQLDENGKIIEDYWTDIRSGSHIPKQIREAGNNYPTLKDEKILERLISICTDRNDLVFDCFMGSGTTQAVAQKLGRRFIGADINLGSIQTTTKRLRNIIDENLNDEDELKSCGFELYNVNNYNIFKNPVQAKELLIEALEIDKLSGSYFDGMKDGRKVKIMPINRIATKKDVSDLITNLDYKAYEKEVETNPNKKVDDILLVCMGHDLDIKPHFQKECPFNIDIEVYDILKEGSGIVFKRDSEASIEVNESTLTVNKFYPNTLLEKLRQDGTEVEDWRETVESIMIDTNYDGSVFEPSIVDIPEKKELVRGTYELTDDAGTIAIKITDLLSESYFEVLNG
ncbi:site-specific DNA-methyltransferase [Malaciobacter canalis]|uniref:Site-specific DNA-methyltransferase n=1 Tax=Malaciobacter canalis TaxID=1912871 RepID=A0ABX4LPD9_9BACT|nr:site-specific DNA-methyltransferase [Malaciobacter canalis]PHO09603.1 site-specific DNA-methyltransferase [Malaciobacter canalis]QEE31672.1 type III restriction/modification system, modification subunit [Malaciobacter canalis]